MKHKSVYLLFCKFTLHISGVNYNHHQEYTKLSLQPPVLVSYLCGGKRGLKSDAPLTYTGLLLYSLTVYKLTGKDRSRATVIVRINTGFQPSTSSQPWSISRGMTSCTGRDIWLPSGVRSMTVLTLPSLPGRSSSISPLFHIWRGWTSSFKSAKSTQKFAISPLVRRTWW